MKTLEEIRQNNRQRLLKHIGQAVYKRAPNPEEVLKINHLIDIGKEISEILIFLRESRKEQKVSSHFVNLKSSIIESRFIDSQNRNALLRTPLEKHFHKYVGP